MDEVDATSLVVARIAGRGACSNVDIVAAKVP